MPRLKGYRFPREVVAYAVWAYHRFALSTADVEDLLADPCQKKSGFQELREKRCAAQRVARRVEYSG
tara:strand:- start:3567 stop:3767 length:201 start_codon:yes stop_codon:yes gene_type:complete